MRRAIIAAAAITAMLAGVLAAHLASRPGCAAPARNADGSYSSYRTGGTMPDGTTVRLSDGDSWTCRSGVVTVH